ncbi:hypothetical protein Tco_0881253 [Tanacetum coccineum]
MLSTGFLCFRLLSHVFVCFRTSSPGPSTPQGFSPGLSIHPSSSSGPSGSAPTECLNYKVKDLKIKMLEARLEMERHPKDHTCQLAAILHELLNEMENLRVE